MNKKVIYKKRIPEPKEMGKEEMKVFEKMSSDNYQRWMIPLVDDVLERTNIKKGAIADIGCGPGLLSKELASRSVEFRVTGVDISSVALDMARKNCKGLSNVLFRYGNVNKLPFQDGTFDIVVCKDGFHHFPSPVRALREMLRVVKGGGILYMQDMRRDLPSYLLKRSVPPQNTLQKLQYYSTRASYTKDEIKCLLRAFPLQHITVKTRIISSVLKQKYVKKGINLMRLKESFQARYIAVAQKR